MSCLSLSLIGTGALTRCAPKKRVAVSVYVTWRDAVPEMLLLAVCALLLVALWMNNQTTDGTDKTEAPGGRKSDAAQHVPTREGKP